MNSFLNNKFFKKRPQKKMSDEMDGPRVMRKLLYKYIYHIIIFSIIFVTHIIIFLYIKWIQSKIKFLFFSFSFIQIIYILIPIIALLSQANRSKLKISLFKKIGITFLILSLLIGLLFSIIIIINTVQLNKFFLECPFNLSYSYFESSFDNYFNEKNKDKLKDKCGERRCILNEDNENNIFQYEYLCNYNPEKELNKEKYYSRTLLNGTKIYSEKQIACSLLEPHYENVLFKEEIIYSFLDKCYFLADFYYCYRLKKPKKYNLKEDEKCIGNDYVFLMGFLSAYIVIFDFILSFIPWNVEIKSYNSIIEIINKETTKNSINKIKRQSIEKNTKNVQANLLIDSDNGKNNNNGKNINIKSENITNSKNNNNENKNLKIKASNFVTERSSVLSESKIFKKPSTKLLVLSRQKTTNDNKSKSRNRIIDNGKISNKDNLKEEEKSNLGSKCLNITINTYSNKSVLNKKDKEDNKNKTDENKDTLDNIKYNCQSEQKNNKEDISQIKGSEEIEDNKDDALNRINSIKLFGANEREKEIKNNK